MRRLGVPEHRHPVIYRSCRRNAWYRRGLSRSCRGQAPISACSEVLERRKGQADFIRAAALLKDRHSTAQFWIVGPLSFADNADYLSELRRLAVVNGLADRVHFTGYRADIPNLMVGMDAVVLGSREREIPANRADRGLHARRTRSPQRRSAGFAKSFTTGKPA